MNYYHDTLFLANPNSYKCMPIHRWPIWDFFLSIHGLVSLDVYRCTQLTGPVLVMSVVYFSSDITSQCYYKYMQYCSIRILKVYVGLALFPIREFTERCFYHQHGTLITPQFYHRDQREYLINDKASCSLRWLTNHIVTLNSSKQKLGTVSLSVI